MNKFIFRKRKLLFLLTIVLLLSFLSSIYIKIFTAKDNLIMGGVNLTLECEEIEVDTSTNQVNYNLEKYFRPSNLKIINTKSYELFDENYGKKYNEVVLPSELFKTPNDTIINYFSILREAANPSKDNLTGCGTIGYAKEPYPIAYNFLTDNYKKEVPYNKYLNSFKNILHINLIKLREVPSDKNSPNSLKYFFELETIQGSDKPIGTFIYYYGYIYLDKEDVGYKISNINYFGENYLCAPYHGWSYDAESIIDIEYGDWCSLVKEKLNTEIDGYEKRIYFKGTDGADYYVLFYELTNGYDIKISDYKKGPDGNWVQINIDTKKCLEKNKKS